MFCGLKVIKFDSMFEIPSIFLNFELSISILSKTNLVPRSFKKSVRYLPNMALPPPSYFTKIKYVSKELSGPVATFIYGDKININIWDPNLVAIVIKSKLVASMYKPDFAS